MFLRFFSYRSWLFCGLLAVFALSGCSPASVGSGNRFFWPLPLDGVEPKIEYIGYWQVDKDLRKSAQASWFEGVVLGEFPAVGLFEGPFWVTFLPDERVAVSDTALRQVLILDLKNVKIDNLKDEDGNPYPFSLPMGVASSGSGEIFVVDSLSGSLLRFGADSKLIEAYGGLPLLGHPVGIAINVHAKKVYVTDVVEHNIAVFDLRGNLLFKIGERGSLAGQFNFPTDVDLDEAGNIYVLDTLNFRVQVFDKSGRFVREFGEQGTEPGSFRLPKGLAVSPHGQVYVSDVLSHKVVVFDYQGRYLLTLGDKAYAMASGKTVPGGFFAPRGIATDATGRILVVDGMNKMIQRFQYLTEDYLKARPILENDIYLPPVLRGLQ